MGITAVSNKQCVREQKTKAFCKRCTRLTNDSQIDNQARTRKKCITFTVVTALISLHCTTTGYSVRWQGVFAFRSTNTLSLTITIIRDSDTLFLKPLHWKAVSVLSFNPFELVRIQDGCCSWKRPLLLRVRTLTYRFYGLRHNIHLNHTDGRVNKVRTHSICLIKHGAGQIQPLRK